MADNAAKPERIDGTLSIIAEGFLFICFIGFVAASLLLVDHLFSQYGLLSALLKFILATAGLFAYCNISSLRTIGWVIGAMATAFIILLFSGLIFIVPPEYWAFLGIIFIGSIMQSRFHSSFLNRETSEMKVFASIILIGLIVLVGVFAAQGAIGSVSMGDRVLLQDMRVTLYDGSILMDRELQYNIEASDHHELYISVNKDGQHTVSLQSESCPNNFRFVQYDYEDRVEYACRNDNGIAPGEHTARFAYSISDPYKAGTDFADLDYIVFDTFGMEIERTQVRFISKLSGSAINSVFTYPFGQASGNTISVGKVGANAPFSVRALVSNPSRLSSYQTLGYAVKPEFDRINAAASLDRAVYDHRLFIFALIALGFIAALYAIYLRFGKEETVPFDIDTLHTLPNEKRKPWEANLLFVGTYNEMDSNALYATIMDLESRKIITIESESRIVYNGVPEGQALDEYETLVANLFSAYGQKSKDGKCVFDAKAIKSDISSSTSLAAGFASDFRKVYEYPRNRGIARYANSLAESAFDPKGYDAAKAFVAGSLFLLLWFFGGAFSIYSWGVLLPLAAFLSALLLMTIVFSEYLFGRYNPGMIEEKRKWDAFSNLLSNYGMIQKYGKEDILMWKNWLIYATALGVAEKAIGQMKKYGKGMSKAAETAYVAFNRSIRFTAGFYALNYHAIASSPSRHGGGGGFGGGGGGFGGGGFGGGGGGAR
jgi:uncharacterized membrane protein YgcG